MTVTAIPSCRLRLRSAHQLGTVRSRKRPCAPQLAPVCTTLHHFAPSRAYQKCENEPNPAQLHAAGAGFTLAEVVLSMAILAILFAAVTSVVVLGARVSTLSATSNAATHNAADVMDQITADVNVALSISEQSERAITMTVPDRGGDGTAETIRYAWSGTAGDPLTRSYNGATAQTILSDVRTLKLSYLVREVGPPEPVESPEGVLVQHDDAAIPLSFSSYTLSKDAWAAMYFKPTFSANTTERKITKVKVRLKQQSTASQTVQIQVRNATGSNLPGTTIMASATVAESTLPASYGWVEVTLSGLTGLDPTKGYVLVVGQTNTSGNAGQVEYESGTLAETDNLWTQTANATNASPTWNATSNTTHMRFQVWGTYTTQDD